ncbi:MAG: ABC-2 family transporter protein [Patescibacteria group bacterium]
MRKYITIFSLSFQNEFTYRLNFILWRLRNVLRILMVITLWNVVLSGRDSVFGYSSDQLIAYVLLASIVQTLVMASPSNDAVGGEIANGDLSNYLVKPISYIKFWFTRDLASKLLNILFAIGEFFFLIIIFRPNISFPFSIQNLIYGLLALSLAIISYFFVSKIAVFVSFWIPENTWGFMFIVLVFLEMLSGVIFPLDVMPSAVRFLVDLTPFPYLVYYPISIYVGKFTLSETLVILLKSSLWMVTSFFIVSRIWRKGLRVYSSEGK